MGEGQRVGESGEGQKKRRLPAKTHFIEGQPWPSNGNLDARRAARAGKARREAPYFGRRAGEKRGRRGYVTWGWAVWAWLAGLARRGRVAAANHGAPRTRKGKLWPRSGDGWHEQSGVCDWAFAAFVAARGERHTSTAALQRPVGLPAALDAQGPAGIRSFGAPPTRLSTTACGRCSGHTRAAVRTRTSYLCSVCTAFPVLWPRPAPSQRVLGVDPMARPSRRQTHERARP